MPQHQKGFGAPHRGMADSDSESDGGMPPSIHGMAGMPPISGPVVTHQVCGV